MHRLRRHALTAGVAGAAIAAIAITSGGVAAASATQPGRPQTITGASRSASLKPVPTARVINLHQRFERALGHIRSGKIGGIIYARGKRPKTAGVRATAGCAEPNCPLVYNGGSVQHAPKVYLLLWGPNWSTDPAQEASYAYLRNFYTGLGTQPQDTWSRATEQYGDSSGGPSFNGSVFGGAWQDSSTPPQSVGQLQLGAEAYSFALLQGIPDWSNAQIVIATQQGTCPQGFACPGTGGNYCAWHSNALGVAYVNLPYQLDAGSSCGENYVRSQYDGFSIVGGHEYAETITDPSPNSGWWDPNDSSGGEIGDKCAWQGLGTVALSTGTFAVQSLYSNATYSATSNGCTLAWPDNVTLSNPGSQSTTVHTSVGLQLQASSSAGYPLTYHVSPLPPGLSLNPTSGLISGSPTTTGIFPISVSVSDPSGASSSGSFNWTINGSGDMVTVTNPGPQDGIQRLRVSLPIKASSSGGYPVTGYSATGLPPGLGINSSTGLISGAPSVVGSYSVRVIATDLVGAAGAVTFNWTVAPLSPPPCGAPRKICGRADHHARHVR